MAVPPVLRALPEVGQSWDDPSEDLLFMLLDDIERGEGSFLIVERTTDPSGQTYAQAPAGPSSFRAGAIRQPGHRSNGDPFARQPGITSRPRSLRRFWRSG